MNRYDAVRTGAVCPNACAFCAQCGGTYRSLPEVTTAVAAATRPANLYFGEGDAAASPHLTPALKAAVIFGLRRVKVKTTGHPLVHGDRLNELIRLGVYLYEIEFLGPNAALHDAIAGRKGAFAEACQATRLIQRTNPRNNIIQSPFLFLTVPICAANLAHLPTITRYLITQHPDRIVYRFTGDVSLTHTLPVVKECLTLALDAMIWPVVSGFPLCVLGGLEYHCQEIYDRQDVYDTHSFCAPCLFTAVCGGVSGNYLETFGAAGLEAVQAHAYAESINRLASMEAVLLQGNTRGPMRRG
jgi:hypothetical protein